MVPWASAVVFLEPDDPGGRPVPVFDDGRWLAEGRPAEFSVRWLDVRPRGTVAYLRLHREFFSRLSLVGADLARVRAVAGSGDALGEGAADLLETDGGLDL